MENNENRQNETQPVETDKTAEGSGHTRQGQPAAPQVFCPGCGGGNAPDAVSCRWCQQPMERARVTPVAAVVAAQNGVPQPETHTAYSLPNTQTHNLQPYSVPQDMQYQRQFPAQQQYPQHSADPQAQGYTFAPQPGPYQPAHVNVIMNNNSTPVVLVNQKSVGVALLLTFLFGPLGMLYSTVAGALVMIAVGLVVGLFTAGCGLALIWPISMVWGALAVSSYNSRLAVR